MRLIGTLMNKKVVISPPQTEFKVQDYPLKRINKGISGWDWQTEVSEEEDLNDRAINCKPKYSTFSKLFPTRNSNMYPIKKRAESYDIEQNLPDKEFNIRKDKLSQYREIMLKAQLVFKMQ
jgi:cytochrome b involved in lipid metabolism